MALAVVIAAIAGSSAQVKKITDTVDSLLNQSWEMIFFLTVGKCHVHMNVASIDEEYPRL